MRALDALRHPGGSARIEDGREAPGRIVQPGRRILFGAPLRQRQDVECRQVAKLVLSPRENDYRSSVVEHVGNERVGQGGIEHHQRAAGPEHAEVRGDDLPVVLRHGHGDHLVRTRQQR